MQKKIAINVDEINTPPMPLLKPLAGFVLDDTGKVVLMAPPQNRTVTIVSILIERKALLSTENLLGFFDIRSLGCLS